MSPSLFSNQMGRIPRQLAIWRGRFYRRLLPGSFGPGCRIGKGAFIDGADRVRLGTGVILGDGVTVAARDPGEIIIGDKTFVNAGGALASTCHGIVLGYDVLLGPHVTIVDQNHSYSDGERPIARQGMSGGGRIEIGDGAWIAAGAVLVGPTTLAAGSVVGANSVVKGHFPRRCVVAGAPARVIRYLDEPGGDTT